GHRGATAERQHLEPDRGDAVDELAEWTARRRRGVEEEAAEPFGLVVLERNGALDSGPAPDAEADMTLVQVVVEVARDSQRTVGFPGPASEELDELQPLRR